VNNKPQETKQGVLPETKWKCCPLSSRKFSYNTQHQKFAKFSRQTNKTLGHLVLLKIYPKTATLPLCEHPVLWTGNSCQVVLGYQYCFPIKL